jgi:hypothetical protein
MERERREILMARREALKRTLSQQRQRSEKQELLAQLDAESVSYRIIWADLPTAEQPTHWIAENFPIAWWGRIDWSLVPASVEKTWHNYSDLVAIFRQLIVDQQLGNANAIATWSDASSLSLELNLDAVARHAELVFQASWDTWILCPDQSWCIECYHEGELCFGREPQGANQFSTSWLDVNQ